MSEKCTLINKEERDIDKLLKKNEEKIEKLKESIKDIYNEKEHDEIYLLRYCLSNPKTDDAEKAIRNAVDYRMKNDSWLKEAEKGEKYGPSYDIIMKYTCVSIHKCKSTDGGPIVIIRANLSNPKILMDTVPEEELVNFLVFQKEVCFRMCDELTRKNRVLTKIFTINDVNGVSMLSNDRRFFKCLGDSSKIADNLFPQLLERNVMMNPPTVFKLLMSFVSIFMSKKSLSKISLCKGNTTKQSISKCPFSLKNIKEEDIPTFLGGKCQCENGCIGGVSNSLKKYDERDK
eukprot:TRINITY_DN1339_c0_g1_i4.p1 TRINITY_DN1339_c0_g1~~TRINITY_DN1339_c0_g1_i4.p1  ORF type:complete len:289 (+),score=77.03 TRINITY_DN1339_c0_g1_i4:290-1156(+)